MTANRRTPEARASSRRGCCEAGMARGLSNPLMVDIECRWAFA